MRTAATTLRTALSLALATPDDWSLHIALASIADSPAYAPGDGGPSPHDDNDPEATRLSRLSDMLHHLERPGASVTP